MKMRKNPSTINIIYSKHYIYIYTKNGRYRCYELTVKVFYKNILTNVVLNTSSSVTAVWFFAFLF